MSAEFQYLYEDWFENITVFDNRAVSAKYSKLRDGKYQVRVSVEAKKYRADGKGQEHLIPLHDLIDVGVLDSDGNFLYLQKQKIEQAAQEVAAGPAPGRRVGAYELRSVLGEGGMGTVYLASRADDVLVRFSPSSARITS